MKGLVNSQKPWWNRPGRPPSHCANINSSQTAIPMPEMKNQTLDFIFAYYRVARFDYLDLLRNESQLIAFSSGHLTF